MQPLIRRIPLLSAAGMLVAIGLASAGPAQTMDMTWYTIDGGGVMLSTGGGFELGGTIGQPDANVAMSGGPFVLESGFWPGAVSATPAGPADCDLDGDIDLADFNCFHACVTGPGGAAMGDCESFDFDGDSDVDLHDWATFQVLFTGS